MSISQFHANIRAKDQADDMRLCLSLRSSMTLGHGGAVESDQDFRGWTPWLPNGDDGGGF